MLLVPFMLLAAVAAPPPAAIVAKPPSVERGGATTLHWYFTGSRVTVRGGRYVHPLVVTGATSLVVRPAATTTYLFDVWYRAMARPAKAEPQRMMTLHARYSVLVPVEPVLTEYRDPHGWSVRCPDTWKRSNVATPDEGSDGLNYFQEHFDDVDRLAVAVLPVSKTQDLDTVMRHVCADIPSHYEGARVDTPTTLVHEREQALYTTFTGLDNTHPGVRTTSMVLTVLHNGRAYVVSARTATSRFDIRRRQMEEMVHSLRFAG